jgi:uncharacterized repeat protein (TIGR01451 family)
VSLAQANLPLTQTDAPDPFTVAGNSIYTFTTTSRGPAGATGVTLNESLPDAVQFVSASPGCRELQGVVTCNIGNIASGSSAVVEIMVAAIRNGIISNTATVASRENDLDMTNNLAKAQTAVNTTGAPLVDITMTNRSAPDPRNRR